MIFAEGLIQTSANTREDDYEIWWYLLVLFSLKIAREREFRWALGVMLGIGRPLTISARVKICRSSRDLVSSTQPEISLFKYALQAF